MRTILVSLILVLVAAVAHAAVKMEPVDYKAGDTTLKGQLAYDDATTEKRPGVLVVHEFWGLNEYAKRRARMLAEAGYVALAVDMFGDGKATEHPDEAGKWASAVRSNMQLGMDRFLAGYHALKADRRVDGTRISAIGYCFGGGIVLNAAMRGAELDAAVSFHGGLPTDPVATKPKARILVCNGAADSFITGEQIASFMKVATDAGADWVFISYAGAKHGFTNPDAGKAGVGGIVYDEKADRRSWATMLDFLGEGKK
jgi:dienelactone hydrolase